MDHQINEQIRDREVRLIGTGGEQLGVMPIAKAQTIAREQNLDLVKIAPKAEPPVCRVMDYGKFRFEQSKKEKEARRHQKTVELKEIRLSPGIDAHDLNFKARNAQRFLEEGDKVKVSIRFRGREMAHTQLGEAQMKRFAETLSGGCVIEKPPKLEGRNMTMFLAPKPPEKPGKP
ncbi:MAG: translation initiation factor IF-3 [Oscillospiraceae bacterium]|nr:translation initiation factor IF-3 [Oscillospiraceae bacterium]